MLVSLTIVFREAVEAGLIVGIVWAATEAAPLSNTFEGAQQAVFTTGIPCFGVAMLSWHILWTSRHAAAVGAELREMGQAVRLGHRSLAAPWQPSR
jgi:high-affinity iron transporter